MGLDFQHNILAQHEKEIPNWFKNLVRLWSEGIVNDSDFMSGIKFLVYQGVLKNTLQPIDNDSDQISIPPWFRINAKWWAQQLISESEFINSVQYLIDNNLMHINETKYFYNFQKKQGSDDIIEFVKVEKNNILPFENHTIWLKIYGKIVGSSGKVFLSIKKPDLTEVKLESYVTNNGDFYSLFPITMNAQMGKYQISALHNNEIFDSTSFNVGNDFSSSQNNLAGKITTANPFFFPVLNFTEMKSRQTVDLCSYNQTLDYQMNLDWICHTQETDYVIYQDHQNTYAKNVKTTKIEFSGFDAARIIQSAIDNLTDGGKIFVKQGSYIITHSILLDSNIVLEGEGWNSILLLSENANTEIIKGKKIGIGKIQIKNLQLDGNRENQDEYGIGGHAGIALFESWDTIFDHLYIRNTDGIAIAIATNPVNTKHQTKNQVIINSIIENPKSDGIWFMGNNGIIANNFIENYNDTGIANIRCINCLIDGNIIIGSPLSYGSGIAVASGSENVVVSKNIIVNSNMGILFERVNLPYSGRGVIIDNNHIDNSKGAGIILQHNASNVKIVNNQIHNNGKSGILLTANNTSVSNNAINHNGKDGITIYSSSNILIERNIIKNNGQSANNHYDGIHITGNSTMTTIKDNFLIDDQSVPTQAYGIRINSSTKTFLKNNTFFGNISGEILNRVNKN